MPSDPQYGRRHFLKDSLISFAKTAQEFVAHRDAPPDQKKPVAPRTDWLRPPGAVPEALFLERCTRCGDCAAACPYDSIRFDAQNGSPVIFPGENPCYVCDTLPCAAACATEALIFPDNLNLIKMGVAVVSPHHCTADQGCNACLSRCPSGALSMDFDTLRVEVAVEHCVGCGLCEYTCKTVNDRTAITVRPARYVGSNDAMF
jgi:ferredoxin-type protein NapG